MQIDKVLEFETDADANEGIDRQKKLGYVCVSVSASAVTSRQDKRVLIPSIVLSFMRVNTAPSAVNAQTGYNPEPRRIGGVKIGVPAYECAATAA